MVAPPKLVQISRRASRRVDALEFHPPVSHVYNPLSYARRPHEEYLRRYGVARPQALLLGMNPGPWGMGQTGVPFGTVSFVRDWLGIEEPVKTPASLHPKRPIQGFDCSREEVSGARVWGWASTRFRDPQAFAEQFFVWNYCPLLFYDEAGRNLTPDKLKAVDKTTLFAACDHALQEIVSLLEPELIIGVGKFAEDRARACLADAPQRIGRILHPSPASPIANRGWAPQAESQLKDLGIEF
ncbi:MAG: single-stranded DNA-binding protein [Planctomycetaceae bacterium]|nr:single-stranded DNA-binding protein [Planctomycetaceae bacterium]